MDTELRLKNPEFELPGINHLAFVCSDMKKTIAFCGDISGMPLVEDIELPEGTGHHADINQESLARAHYKGMVPQPRTTDKEDVHHPAVIKDFKKLERQRGSRLTTQTLAPASVAWVATILVILGFLTAMLMMGIAISV